MKILVKKIILAVLINSFMVGFSFANERAYLEQGDISEEITKYVAEVSADLHNRYGVRPDKVFFLFNGEKDWLEEMADFFLSPASAEGNPAGVVAFLDGKNICFIYGEKMRYCDNEEQDRVQALMSAQNLEGEANNDTVTSCDEINMARWLEENPAITGVVVAVATTGAVLFFVPTMTTVGASLVLGTSLMSVSGLLYAEVMQTACDGLNNVVSQIITQKTKE